MSPVLSAFPSRPLRIAPGRGAWRAWLLAAIGVVLFGGFLALLALDIGPAIRDDFAVRDQARATAEVRVVHGTCRSRFFLLQDCDLTLGWRGKTGSGTRKVSYFFVEPHMGSWTAQAMADPARLELVTTDIGLDRLWNRVATAAGGGVVALALIAGLFMQVRQGQGAQAGGQAKAMAGRPLRPVAVRFMGWEPGPAWRVQDEHGAEFTWPVRQADTPFVLDQERGLVLALRDPAGGSAFPLDDKLQRVVLSDHERARIQAARPATR